MEDYKSKAITTTIKAESKTTIKVRDNFYSVVFTEERTIPDIDGVDLDMERTILFDEVNAIVDAQAEDIIKTFR